MSLDQLIPWNWGKNGESLRENSKSSFSELQKEMNRLFENFSENMFSLSPMKRTQSEISVAFPKMDVSETEKEFKVSAELPGMDEKDIDVSVSNEVLTIKGEKKAEKEEKKPNYYRMERSYGTFHSPFLFPARWRRTRLKPASKRAF